MENVGGEGGRNGRKFSCCDEHHEWKVIIEEEKQVKRQKQKGDVVTVTMSWGEGVASIQNTVQHKVFSLAAAPALY